MVIIIAAFIIGVIIGVSFGTYIGEEVLLRKIRRDGHAVYLTDDPYYGMRIIVERLLDDDLDY